ncbi:MAG: HAD-superfamily hydrolase, subfamily variant 3 [Bryobacterales bacterium]|jgi:phosphoglycolate phosphatase|nr:HAD-superfamily hydrolase, subfamily variant 3 [Bryobacterales bacterium]
MGHPDGLKPVPPFPVYLFDVDGTLMDSAPDICAAQLEVLATHGCSTVTEEVLRRYIGRHLIDLFQDLGFGTDAMDPLIQSYRTTYWDRKHAATRVFPGVAEMLDSLGGRKSTATTKTSRTTRDVLEQFGLIQHFEHVQGTDGFPAKPEPDVILAAVRALGANPEECLLVGDSAADVEAGRRAGVRVCAVRWGYGDHQEMARWEPDYWIDEPRQLLAS